MDRNPTRKIASFIRPGSQEGFALIIALMLLAILSLLGAAAILTTNVELKISGNTRAGRTAFFGADGAGEITAGVIEDCITDVGWSPGYNYGTGVTANDGQFAFEDLDNTPGNPINEFGDGPPPSLGGTEVGDADQSDDLTDPNDVDISITSPMEAVVDVDKGPTVPLPGASSITASGYDGAGKGAASGGMKTVYHIRTKGTLKSKAMSLMFMTYDHIL